MDHPEGNAASSAVLLKTANTEADYHIIELWCNIFWKTATVKYVVCLCGRETNKCRHLLLQLNILDRKSTYQSEICSG